MSRLTIGTKAETLESLRALLTRASVSPSILFTVAEWQAEKDALLSGIQDRFSDLHLIIRSSALNEDSLLTAMAGVHDSIQNVPANSVDALTRGVDAVIASYLRHSENSPADQVLIQPMIRDVSMSGVVFTRDLNTGAPYYVINYDDETGRTDTITSGITDNNRTLLVHRHHTSNLSSPRFKALLTAIEEIESLSPADALDIEFAVTEGCKVHILQARRITVQRDWYPSICSDVTAALDDVEEIIPPLLGPSDGLCGENSILGIMPDWNPAEMIGSVPRSLATSLYRHLITDSIWAEARAAMGYKDLTNRPLLLELAGHPYIDIRKSFNSFLPRALDNDISDIIVSEWVCRLAESPELHDKIEFEIATTIHCFDTDEHCDTVLADVLSETQLSHYKQLLLELTNDIIAGSTDFIATSLQAIHELKERRSNIMHRTEDSTPLLTARKLLDDCKIYGTKPFSILARCAFIAESFLRSCTSSRTIPGESIDRLRASIHTVLSSFLEMVDGVRLGTVSRDALLAEYGHLRPGTYDILSPRYDQRSELTATAAIKKEEHELGAFELNTSEREALDAALASHGYSFDSTVLMNFILQAIPAREYAKLTFTRNISDALECLAEWGAGLSLSREELAHLSIEDILNSEHDTDADKLRAKAESARESHRVAQAIRLPYLIRQPEDIHIIPLLKTRPNFITKKQVRAPGIHLTGEETRSLEIDRHIVLIEGADPGYDWIFMKKITGLVTRFGGANSHMAIRCAELSIPAAIGCGEQLFDLLKQAPAIFLDCSAELVEPSI